MLAFLPAICLVLVVVSLRLRTRNESWREAFLAASVLLGVLTVLGTEVLSLFHLITFPVIVCFWAAATLGAGIFLYLSTRRSSGGFGIAGENLTPGPRLLLGGIALFVVAIALIAFLAPPNTGDSFEYHMPKVAQWAQNHSITFFPTAIPRQNHLAPGAEYAVLHLQVLSGSDRFANFVDWMAMLGSLAAVSLVARQLGAQAKGQMLAAVFALTLPMGIMQASSTQTDYVVAFWLICFVHYLLQLRGGESPGYWPLLAMSASLGLAVFSKATAYLLAPAFLLWLGLSLLKFRKWEALKPLAAFTLVFLCINAGHYQRNQQMYGRPLGPGQEPEQNTRYSLETHAPKALLSNLSKHVSTHLGTPWPKVNTAVTNFFVRFHEKLGIDVNDTQISWGTGKINSFGIRRLNYADEVDGNPLHFLLVLLSAALLLFSSTLRKERVLLRYAGAVAAGALLFVLYLKWHPWMSRLHLPIFVLAAPLVGIVLSRLWNAKVVNLTAAALMLLGIPWLLFCQQRPMAGQENVFNTPRDRLYMTTRRLKNIEPSFLNGKALLQSRNASQIGLLTGNSSIEYWWWAALRKDHPEARFQHVNVQEPSNRLYTEKPFCDFRPDAVLALDQRPSAPQITVGQVLFSKQWEEGRAAIYLPASDVQTLNR